jgi:hypothetical protein
LPDGSDDGLKEEPLRYSEHFLATDKKTAWASAMPTQTASHFPAIEL